MHSHRPSAPEHLHQDDSYPIPSIDNIVNWLSTKKYFSTLDLRSGYWAVKLEETSRKLTAVKTA
jgi:hypothetical protein